MGALFRRKSASLAFGQSTDGLMVTLGDDASRRYHATMHAVNVSRTGRRRLSAAALLSHLNPWLRDVAGVGQYHYLRAERGTRVKRRIDRRTYGTLINMKSRAGGPSAISPASSPSRANFFSVYRGH
jgi:hypothetical protein